jgi:DNA-binding NarL/FixJ family response regulator
VNSAKPISVLLVEDHTLVREALAALLALDGFKTIGQALTGREAVEMAQTLRPDVNVMDIAMPVLNGIEATRQIIAANPSARVLILSAHTENEYIERMSAAGAVGFVEKQTSAEILVRAINEVAEGRRYYSPSIARRLCHDPHQPLDRKGAHKVKGVRLTSRESEVLQLVAEGSANKQVAATLGISIKTVEKHRQHLMDKLSIHDTAGLTRYAIASGVIENRVQSTTL